MASGSPPRTLADQLRDWPDTRLANLLRERPDLASPAPQDSAQLASRAAVRSSLLSALELLDRPALAVLEALVALGPQSREQLRTVVHASPESVDAATDRLVDLALAWGRNRVRALSPVADGLVPGAPGTSGLRATTSPAGVAPVAERMSDLPATARALLEHLDAHGGEGSSAAEAGTPAGDLVARRLVLPRPGGVVVLPADVAVALRGGRTTSEPVDRPPALGTSARDQRLVEQAAAGAAFEAVRRTDLLLETWGSAPPGVLRSGGLGVRDLRAAAALLHVGQEEAALLIETAAGAGLLAQARPRGSDGPVWAPTDRFDRWHEQPVARQWLTLATAWLESPRLVGLVGGRDRAGRAWNALTPELTGPFAVDTRRRTLTVLAELPDGQVLSADQGVPSLVARLEWLRPRRPVGRAEQAAWTLTEAAQLGLVGLGGLSSAGRAVLDGRSDAAIAGLAPLLPETVDRVLVQADLTAIAPGPLETSTARRLHQLADVESRGGATVHRFTPDSLRRALDAGWTAEEVHRFLATVSSTPVPQSLTFLVDDVARTHGSVRVGHAEAYLRADDEAALAGLLHHPEAGSLELQRLAPTVLISTLPLELLLPRLRELGCAPVAESPDGVVHVERPEQVRARGRRSPSSGAREARRTAEVESVVAAVRAGDRATASRPAVVARLTPAETLARLREAVEAGRSVWIGYVDNHGTRSERVVDPRRVDGGQLTAYDHRSADTRGFAIHRITAVRPVP